MKTDNLRINQLSSHGYAWYLEYLAALDAKNVRSYGAFLASNCRLQTNNQPPLQGKDAILAGLSHYWTLFGELEHDLLNIYGDDHAFMLEALNHYRRQDGKSVSIRAVALTDRNEAGLVVFIRLYTDTTPLFAPAE